MFFSEQSLPFFTEKTLTKHQNDLEDLVRSKPFCAGAIEVELETDHDVSLYFETEGRARSAIATARGALEFSEREGKPMNVRFYFNRGTARHSVGKSVFFR